MPNDTISQVKTVDGTILDIRDDSISVTQTVSSGTKIGTVKYGTSTVDLYAPSGAGTPFYQAGNVSTSTSITAGTMTQIELISTGAISSGTGFSISNGGIKVTNAGKYLVAGSLYMNDPSGVTGRGVYIHKGATYATATEVYGNIYESVSSQTQAGAIALAPRYLELSANDILYLSARMVGAAGSASGGNAATFLSITGPIPAPAGGSGATTATLSSSSWSSNSQTVNVTGVSSSSNIIVSPAPTDATAYADAGILCTAQGSGTLTFTCSSVPSSNITVNVLIM